MAESAGGTYGGVCFLLLNTSRWPELTQEGDMFAELCGPSGHQGGGTDPLLGLHRWAAGL